VDTWRKLGIGSLIAFFGLTLSLLAFGVNLYRQNSDLIRQLDEGKNELRHAIERITKIEAQIDQPSRADTKSPTEPPEVSKHAGSKKN